MNLKNLAIPLAILMLNSTAGRCPDEVSVQARDSRMAYFERANVGYPSGIQHRTEDQPWRFDLENKDLCALHLKSLLDKEDYFKVWSLMKELQEAASDLQVLILGCLIFLRREHKEAVDDECLDLVWNHDNPKFKVEIRELRITAGYVRALIYSFRMEFNVCWGYAESMCHGHENLAQLKDHFELTLYLLHVIMKTFLKVRRSSCFAFTHSGRYATEVVEKAQLVETHLLGVHEHLFKAARRLGLHCGDTLFDYLRGWSEIRPKEMRHQAKDDIILQLAHDRYLYTEDRLESPNIPNRYDHNVGNDAGVRETVKEEDFEVRC